jgi:hypothetical protein
MKCVVKSCKCSNVRTSVNYCTFHKIPKDPVLRRKWLRSIGRDPKEFSVNSAGICTHHFDPTCYVTVLKNGLLQSSSKRLKKDAIPTLFFDHGETSWIQEEIEVVEIVEIVSKNCDQ